VPVRKFKSYLCESTRAMADKAVKYVEEEAVTGGVAHHAEGKAVSLMRTLWRWSPPTPKVT